MSGTKKTVGAITVVLAAFGGVVMLGTAASAAVTGASQLGPQSGTLTADADGVGTLDLDVSASQVRVEFGDVDQVELRVDGGPASDWEVTRDGDRLDVRGPDRSFSWWQPDWLSGEDRATLVLPQELLGLDADLSLQAGSLDVEGEFGELGVDVSAGGLTVTGDARLLDAQVNAGRAELTLAGVESASYRVSAGRLVGVLRDAPNDVDVSVSAGSLDLTVPDVAYDVIRDVSAGEFTSRVDEQRGGDHRISASVSAGSAVVRPLDDRK